MSKGGSISRAHKKGDAYAVEAQEHRAKAKKNLVMAIGLFILIAVLLVLDLRLTTMGYMQNAFFDFNLFVMLGLFVLVFIDIHHFDVFRKEQKAYQHCVERCCYYSSL